MKVRKQLGKLRDLTVQSSTRRRYNLALEAWGKYLVDENIYLPKEIAALDPILADYIEHLWSTGAGRALASDTVAAVQDKQPQTRNRLPSVWRLLKAWSMHEIPNRAPPLPEPALKATVGLSFFRNDYYFGLSLLLGYYGMLRTGELLAIQVSHVTISRERGPAVISLGYTKGGRRAGAAESVTIGVESVCRILWKWTQSASKHKNLCPASHVWRKKFNDVLESLNFTKYTFRPYSLRRGGSTFWFGQHSSLDRLCVQGRWASHKTARVYVNEGLALLAEITLPWTSQNSVFLVQYAKACKAPVPKLEPTVSVSNGRTGGRGNRNLGVKRGQKKGQKKPLFQITRNSHMVLRVGVSMFSRLGGRLGSTLGFWLPCSWLGGSSGRGPNEVVNFCFFLCGLITLFDKSVLQCVKQGRL